MVQVLRLLDDAFRGLDRFGRHSLRTFRTMVTPPFSLRETVAQMERLGVQSLTIVNMCAIFTGMVLTLQIAAELARFGSKPYISRIVGVAFVREIGPAFTALMFAGRVGSGIAAELGSMSVTEQIDALRAMGADPFRRLVVPRIVALLVMVPAMTVIADLLGIFAGLLMAMLSLGVGYAEYVNNTLASLTYFDIYTGLIKAFIFGLEIGLVSTFMGLGTERGTEGVGRSTTRAMVTSVYAIVVSDFVLTKLFLSFGEGLGG